MRIVINSNFRFYEKSLPIILPSIPENEHNVEVIIGGSPWEYKKEVKGNVNYHFVNYHLPKFLQVDSRNYRHQKWLFQIELLPSIFEPCCCFYPLHKD